MVDQVARHAKRKAETERMAKAARDRARQARDAGAAGGGAGGEGSGGASASFSGNPLGRGAPEGWKFDESREPAFGEQRLNSQVLGGKVSTVSL